MLKFLLLKTSKFILRRLYNCYFLEQLYITSQKLVSENEKHELNVRILKSWLMLLNEESTIPVSYGLVAELALFIIQLENNKIKKC